MDGRLEEVNGSDGFSAGDFRQVAFAALVFFDEEKVAH
jgi:hypothetical protein